MRTKLAALRSADLKFLILTSDFWLLASLLHCSILLLYKFRHDPGGKQLHAAHDSVVRDHATGVKPTDHPTHVELLLQPFQPFYTRLRCIEDRHHLTHLLIRHPTNALQNFLDASGPSFLPPVVGRVERSDRL